MAKPTVLSSLADRFAKGGTVVSAWCGLPDPSVSAILAQEDFDAVMHTNVLGAMQALPQVAPLVAEARGVFAFLSSSMSLIGSVPNSVSWLYRTSKAALNMAVAAAQHDYPQATLVTLDPGWVRTDMGGAGGLLEVAESVERMRAVLGSVTPGDRGRLLHHDGRRAMQW